MGVNFVLFVIDRNKLDLKVKEEKILDSDSSLGVHLLRLGSKGLTCKKLFQERAYWMEILYKTSRKKLFKEYAVSVKMLLDGSHSDSVFDFQQESINKEFLKDSYGNHIGILNAENSSKFIDYLKKLVREDFVYIEDCNYENDFLSNQPSCKEYDKDQEGKKFITKVTQKERVPPYLDDIIKGFEEFPSSEKCLIGFYC
ncbi:hypothetical protein HY990_05660 [Candidatus Micrarchaeota archaeon]|nr:hypothetical protein [Candidatus Micrarchaeota archaeon]